MASYNIGCSFGTTSEALSNTISVTGSSKTEISESIANSQTDADIVVAIDVSAVKAFYIRSSQDVTVETNDGSSPDDTLSLLANRPYIWDEDDYDSFLLTADVTVLYITNASGSTADIEIRVLQDATP